MDDHRNNRYDDFFHPFRKEEDRLDKKEESESEHSSSESPYYYSYGPFRSQREDARSTERQSLESVQDSEPSAQSAHSDQSQEVVTYPQEQVQQTDMYRNDQSSTHTRSDIQYSYPKRRRWFSSFAAAFFVCALVMTSLVYASDVNNWFTGSSANASGGDSGRTAIGQTVAVDTGSGSQASGVIRPNTIADIVEQASPAVVLIETYVSSGRSYRGSNNMDFFEYFFGDRIQVQPDDSNNGGMINSGIGSGFIFDKDGYILTNEHVVDGAEEIYVTVEGHKERYKAELLGKDFDLDLAVLKISGNEDFSVLPIGDSGSLRVGDWVTAIGNPGGFEHTVSVGVLSGTGRNIQIPEGNQTRNYEQLLQTDAAINPGNSGGPLINMNGEVVGINTAVSVNSQGIGFAIPSSTIVSVVDLLKNNETVPKPYIGVVVANIDESWLEDLKLDSTDGAIVTQVESGSPAARAGIQAWDVIVKINDKDVKNFDDVKKHVQELGVNTRATVTIIRDGKEIQAGIIIGDRNG